MRLLAAPYDKTSKKPIRRFSELISLQKSPFLPRKCTDNSPNSQNSQEILRIEQKKPEISISVVSISEDVKEQDEKFETDGEPLNLKEIHDKFIHKLPDFELKIFKSVHRTPEILRDSLKKSLKSAKEKIIQAKRKILIDKEQDQLLIGMAAWKSLRNLIELLPKYNGLMEIISEFSNFTNEWKAIFFKSYKEMRGKEGEFPLLPGNSQMKLSSLETLILIKYLRPEEIENYVKNFNSATFKKSFLDSSNINLEFLNNSANSRCPTVIFTSYGDRNIVESIELKGLSLKNPINTVVLSVLGKNNEIFLKEIEKIAGKGLWMIVENFEILDEETLKIFIKKVEFERNNPKTSNNWKIWLIYKVKSDFYGKIPANSCEFLSCFLGSCSKIFINSPENIKDQLSMIYTADIQEYEKKTLSKQASYSNKQASFGLELKSVDNITSIDQEIRQFRTKLQKKSDFCSLNSFIDRFELSQKNANFSVLLDKVSEKLRFKLSFIWSIFLERRKFDLNTARYRKTAYSWLPSREFVILFDDIFTFLSIYMVNPFIFIEKACAFERESYGLDYGSLNDPFLRKLLNDYVFADIETQMVIEVKNFKYELFTAGLTTKEEKIYKTISSFPAEDPIEILGFNLNNEILLNYKNSNKLMQFVLKQEKTAREMEIVEDKIMKSIEILKFIELEKNENSDFDVKVKEYMDGNLKEFLKLILKIFKDSQKSIEIFIDLSNFQFLKGNLTNLYHFSRKYIKSNRK